MIILGLTESFLFSILQIFIFVWSPIIKELNSEADTSEIFLLFMLSMMLGGTLFKVKFLKTFKLFKIFYNYSLNFRL